MPRHAAHSCPRLVVEGADALADPAPSPEPHPAASTVSPSGCRAFSAGMSTLATTITHLRSGAAGPGGCAARRPCPAASASPGPQRPPASRRRPWVPAQRPAPCPGCRPGRRGRRTAASPAASTRRRPTGPPAGPPSPSPHRRGPPARCRPVPRLPEPPGLVDRAHRARLRRLRLVRQPHRSEELVDQLLEAAPGPVHRVHRPIAYCHCCRRHRAPPKCLCFVALPIAPACGQRRRAAPGWRRPLRVGMDCERAGAPSVSA